MGKFVRWFLAEALLLTSVCSETLMVVGIWHMVFLVEGVSVISVDYGINN